MESHRTAVATDGTDQQQKRQQRQHHDHHQEDHDLVGDINIGGDTGGGGGGGTDGSSSPTANGNGRGKKSQLLECSFNQDGGCLALGTTTGFSVHNLHPQYSLSVERHLRGGIGKVEMLFRCNLMALVGGGPTPHSAPHRVLIWDDHVPKEIGELSFRQAVLKVRLRKDAIAVALRDRVYVYTLADLSLRDKIYTADNPHGLLSLSTQVQDMVLACPSVTTGHVRVELYGLRKTVVSLVLLCLQCVVLLFLACVCFFTCIPTHHFTTTNENVPVPAY